jgi:FkbM family methyltransferase
VKGAAHGWPNGQLFWTPTYIQRLGFHPATMVDVGVGPGTPDIYEAFPDSYLVLVDPLEEFVPGIRHILSGRPGVHIPAALGSSERTQTFLVEPDQLQGSSLYAYDPKAKTRDAHQSVGKFVRREVQVTTLDALLAKHAWKPPFGLKLDAQGAELEIILGGPKFLSQAEFVISEVNLIDRYPGSYTVAQFIAALDSAGFELCDLFDISRTPSAQVRFVDMVFRRKAACRS